MAAAAFPVNQLALDRTDGFVLSKKVATIMGNLTQTNKVPDKNNVTTQQQLDVLSQAHMEVVRAETVDARRIKVKKMRGRNFRPHHPSIRCGHCAEFHANIPPNYRTLGRATANDSRGRSNGTHQKCWYAAETERAVINYMAKTTVAEPNGTNIMAPDWYRGKTRVWRKDDTTGVIRPRRMMDDMADKKKADQKERLARSVEADEGDYDEEMTDVEEDEE